MRLGVLHIHPTWQVRFLGRDEAGSAKDLPGLLELRWVRKLLLTVTSDEDLIQYQSLRCRNVGSATPAMCHRQKKS